MRRACYAADRTGHMILQTLYQQCIKNDVNFFDEFHVLDLHHLRTASARASWRCDIATGEIHTFHAKAVLFATGGYGRMFKITSNALASPATASPSPTGAGMPLEDMEFFQFHPTGIYKMGILITEAARGEGGDPAQRQRRALHGALRAHAEGPGPARHGLAGYLQGDPRGAGHRRQGLCAPRPHATWARR